MSSTTTKAHPLSPRRRWAQWRFQHPNETRSILLWLVILDSWLVGLLTPLLDFEDLRSSVQPFAAGSTLPLWPAWQNPQKELGKVVFLHPVRPFFSATLGLCCLSFGPFGKIPNCNEATSLSLTSCGYWTHWAEFSNLYSIVLFYFFCSCDAFLLNNVWQKCPHEPFHLLFFHKMTKPASSFQKPHQLQHWLRYLDNFGYLDDCLLLPLQPVNNVCH